MNFSIVCPDPSLENERFVCTCYSSIEMSNFVEKHEFPNDCTLLQALSLDIIDWMNFTIFLNAWNLGSHEIGFPNGGDSERSTWNLVNTLLRKYILETIKSAGPIISSPGNNLLLLVQLITEPLAWHCLIIQSCIRSLLPSGKKKKKGGPVEQSNSQLSNEIRDSIQSICETIEVVTKWLKEQLQTPNDEKFETAYSSVQKNGTQSGPGKVFKVLESSVSVMKDADVGYRILEALRSWSPPDVVRKIVGGQDGLLSEFLKICESKIKLLQSLRSQL